MKVEIYKIKLNKAIEQYRKDKFFGVSEEREQDIINLKRIIDHALNAQDLQRDIVSYLDKMKTGLCTPSGKSSLKKFLLKVFEEIEKDKLINQLQEIITELQAQNLSLTKQLKDLRVAIETSSVSSLVNSSAGSVEFFDHMDELYKNSRALTGDDREDIKASPVPKKPAVQPTVPDVPDQTSNTGLRA